MNKPGLKKSKSYFFKRSASMDFTGLVIPNDGEGLVHFSHPQHPLYPISMPYLFTCMGCKEYGAGRRFRCPTCDFDLHDFCALAPPSIEGHPLHSQHQLIFHTKHGNSGLLRSRCEICNKTTKGFAFRCPTCNFEVHPCCTLLQQEMAFPTHLHMLYLSPATATPTGNLSFNCDECRRKRSGQVYHCAICGYHLHAVCAKDMVNGLYVHGIRAPEKSSMLGVAARLAAHAVTGFIGGFIEGIGQAVGGVVINNADCKGSPSTIVNNAKATAPYNIKAIAPREAK